MSEQTKLLSIKNVSHTFVNKNGAFKALEQININIDKGEFVSFVGPSGCGKTTLLNIIAGFIKASDGEILLNGAPLELGTHELGYMQQQDYLFPWRSIYDNILLGSEIKNDKGSKDKQKVDDLLGELELERIGDKFPHQLSGGMRQRVALARTLIMNPNILLLDEPFSALDLHIKIQLEQLVKSTLRKLNKTAILVTHDIAEAVAISDTVYIFARSPGRIEKYINIPKELASVDPLLSRKHPLFNKYFDEIWTSLNQHEQIRGEKDVVE